MPIRIDGAQVRGLDGELHRELVGQSVRIVTRDTTTAFPIQNGAGDPISGSDVTVLGTYEIPRIWIDIEDPADLYLDWLDVASGVRGPVDFDAALRDAAATSAAAADASATSAATSATSAATTATDVAALRGWIDKGVTTRNVVTNPRATDAARWSRAFGGLMVADEVMVTDATDGPVLPDGTRVTSYARYTISTVGAGSALFGYTSPSAAFPTVPVGKSLAVAIYVRSSVSAPGVSARKDGYLSGVASGGAQSGPNSTLPADAWQRRSAVVINNAECNEARVSAQFPEASRSVDQVIDVVCALLVIDTPSVPDHFDGATPSTNLVGYGWEGTANASVSRRIDMRLVRTVNGQVPDASGNVEIEAGGGTSDHNALSNLTSGDPHTQYLTPARGDQRYYSRAQVDAQVAAAATQTSAADRQRSNHTGTQGMGTIEGLQAALDAAGGGSVGPDVPRVRIVSTGNEERASDAITVFWLDTRDPSAPQPVNFGANDIRMIGAFVAGADLIPPSVPTGLTTGSITASGVTLSWDASTDNVGVTGYEVRRDGSSSLGVATGTSRVITGLSQNTEYSLQVRARDAAGNWSSWSSVATFTTSASSDTTAPTVPTGLASSSITGSGFTVTWGAGTDNVGVTGYDIRLNGGAPETVAADPRTKTFSSLAAETAYTVGIRSRDAAGNTSAYVDLVVTTGEADALTYNVFGAGAPAGTWAWGSDGTPYIVTSRGFRCTADGARAVGGRAWIPTAASGSLPTEATFYLFGPNASIDTAPVQTKVVSTAGATAGSWVEGVFDTPQVTGDDVWVIGVRFTGAGDAGKYTFGTGCRPSAAAVPSVGPLGEELGWIEYGTRTGQIRIGTGSVIEAASDDHGRGLDITVDLEG